jgi:hypothetical protein
MFVDLTPQIIERRAARRPVLSRAPPCYTARRSITPMPHFIYQANFCAECGNQLPPRQSRFRRWQSRYFCAECATRLRWYKRSLPWLLAAGLLSALFFFDRTQPTQPAETLATASFVSAHDATAQLQPAAPPAAITERVLCGARTKRGTPCRHLVPPGQRCAQHRGRPSILSSQ